jgi:hypothetical protein
MKGNYSRNNKYRKMKENRRRNRTALRKNKERKKKA